jgi:HK97 family phage major capsid protein
VEQYVENLRDARMKAWNEAQAVLETAATETRELTPEEKTKFDKINEDIDAKDTDIRSYVDLQTREREADQAREMYSGVITDRQQEQNDKTDEDRLRSWARGETRAVEFDLTKIAAEKNMIRAGLGRNEFRDLSVGTSTAGGDTVPTDFVRRLYEFLEIYSGVRKTNVTVITTAGGEALEFPKVTAHGTAAFVEEASALAEADPAVAKMTLNAYKYGQLLQASSELLTDSGVDIIGFIAMDCGRAIGRVTDTAYLHGSGSGLPKGALLAMGTALTSQTVATGQPSYANLVDTVYSVNAEYRANGAQWLMNDGMAGTIRKMVDGNGRPLWEPSVQVGQPDRILGFPVLTDPNLTAVGTAAGTPIAFGDWSTFYIRDVGSVRLERSDDYAFANDLVTWRCIFRTDSDLIDATGSLKRVMAPTT